MSSNPENDQERERYTRFATQEADPAYQSVLKPLYESWRRWNQDYCAGQLLLPHLAFGPTPSRTLGYCAAATQYGGHLQITLNAGLVFGTNPRWVVRPWPADGIRLFIEDLLLRLTIRHYVLEAQKVDETGYDGFGPLFAAKANAIGAELGLAAVGWRYRAGDSLPQARFWPHHVWLAKDPGRYGGDVTDELLSLAAGTSPRRQPPPPSLAVWELILLYHRLGRPERLATIATEHVAWLNARQKSRLPAPRHRLENGLQDTDGQPLGEVAFDPAWLTRHDGAVRKIAAAIDAAHDLADLPILAAALAEAGCTEGRILRHLRHPIEHTRSCWILRGLLQTIPVV